MAYNKETGMWEGFIYIIRNDIHPEKYYIGQTCNSVLARWRGHVEETKEKNHTYTDKLHNAMHKYGIEHFGADTIASYCKSTKEELLELLDEMEIYYIKKFNSFYGGYNLTKGGRGASEHQMRRVCQYDLDGNFIMEHKSVDALKQYLNLENVSSVYDCCYHDNSRYAYGYIWRYADDSTPLPILTPNEKREARNRYLTLHPIDKYDYKGKKINTYKNLTDAALNNPHVKKQQIYDCCVGHSVYAGIDVYRFSIEEFNTYKTYRDKPKLVEQYDMNKNLIDVYSSAREAGRINDIAGSAISSVCRHEIKTAGGYYWKYVEDTRDFEDVNHNGHCKTVYQYDKQGNLLQLYDSLQEASLRSGVNTKTISHNAKDKSKAIYLDHVWSYKPLSKDEIIEKTISKHCKPVNQYDLQGNYIATYTSGKEAAKQFTENPNSNNNIYNCCRGIKKSAFGYIWRYVENVKEGA